MPGAGLLRSRLPRTWLTLALAAAVVVFLSRIAHLRLVWVEEAYGVAAAAQIISGKALYSEIWFDKPPLYACYYLLCGGGAGWPLRILDTVLVFAAAACTGFLAAQLWTWREALIAGALVCFFLTFWIPSAVMAVAPDQLMIAPHALAVLFAIRKRPALAGVWAGVAALCNSKGVLVLAAVLLWAGTESAWAVGCFALVQGTALLILPAEDYWREVWLWGFRYSADTFIANPVAEGLRRTLAWAGFHSALLYAAAATFMWERHWRLVLWLLVSATGVIAGWRFFPRYYFILLPPLAVAAARGFTVLTPRWRIAVCSLLCVPALRFGPRYISLFAAGPQGWSDAALMEDSRNAASILRSAADNQRDTLLVWGYRPDIYVFSELRAGTRFLDSQPLTGVLADRHLTSNERTLPDIASKNRRELVTTSPVFIADGLGPLNPSLAPEAFADLRPWLSRYDRIGATGSTIIYKLRTGPERRPLPEER